MLTLVPKILQLKSSKTLNPVLFLLVLGSNFCIYIFSFVFVAGGCFHHKYMEIQPLLQQLVNLAGHCSQGGTDQFSPIILTVFLNTSPRPPWPPPRRPSRRPPVVHESVEPGGNLGGTTWNHLGETTRAGIELQVETFEVSKPAREESVTAFCFFAAFYTSWLYMVLQSTFYMILPFCTESSRSGKKSSYEALLVKDMPPLHLNFCSRNSSIHQIERFRQLCCSWQGEILLEIWTKHVFRHFHQIGILVHISYYMATLCTISVAG